MPNKPVSTMERAIRSIDDGDQVYIGGFGFSEPFSASHELIRDGKRDLNVIRSSGGVLLDQLIGAGCIRKATIAHCWNAVGPMATHAFRRAAEDEIPHPITIEEYGLGNLVLRLFAGARRLPFIPAGPVENTGQYENRDRPDKYVNVDFDGRTHYVMKPLNPDVSIIHAQRGDNRGNVQLHGPRAELKYGALAADCLIVTVEELVSPSEIQQLPESTIVPGVMVDYVIESNGGSHPSGIPSGYDRDIDFLEYYGKATKTHDGFHEFIDTWITDVADRSEYNRLVRNRGFHGVER